VDQQLATRSEHRGTLSLERLQESAQVYVRASKAPNTLRAYRSDLADFELWCEGERLSPLPAAPQTIAVYLAALADAGAKASTIQRRLAAISQARQLAGHEPSPTTEWVVRAAMSGIRRTIGTASAQKAAISTAELRRMIAGTPSDTLAGLRDRALLLIGFAGGFRRSELRLPRRRRRAGNGARPARNHPALQDRPGGAGTGDRAATRAACRDVPGAGGAGLA
jgi:site-specific recombinase XerD